MKKLFLVPLCLFILLPNVLSDQVFNFDYDYAFFKDESSKIYVEFYYAFNQNELKFVKSGSGYEAKGKIYIDVFSTLAGKNVIMKDFNVPVFLEDTTGKVLNSKLTGQINFLLDTGAYKFNIKAFDYNDTSKFVKESEDIVLKPIPSEIVSSSSVVLASNIAKSTDDQNIFYKNTLEVIPNPSLLFGNNLSKLYYYIELYNLRPQLMSQNYSVNVNISDIEGKEIKSEVHHYELKADSKVEYGFIDISDVPTGKYIFNIKVMDVKNSELMKAFKVFYIFNSNVTNNINTNNPDLDNAYLASEYVTMPEDEVENEFNKAIYLMTGKERKNYEKLGDVETKRKFMFLFWKKFDTNPATIMVEFKKEYFERISFSNSNFRSDFREGWKTDRGRIYCIYGKYDEIE